MNSTADITIKSDAQIVDALGRLDKTGRQIVLVVDDGGKVVGTLTDGDIRRGLLRGLKLEAPVNDIMQSRPFTVAQGVTPSEALAIMRANGIRQLPTVDAAGRPVSLFLLDELLGADRENVSVVIMAGGLGSRLRPLTETTPKPLIQVGGRPLLETTIVMLASQGFRDVTLCVNYMADAFRSHFGDGIQFGARVAYLEETERLGTAGALSMLPASEHPRIVLNGDILTTLEYGKLIDFHRANEAPMTLCVREFEQTIPYGVVRLDDGRFSAIEEKPVYKAFVSAGIYVLEPCVFTLLARGEPCDMPTLIDKVHRKFGVPAVYPLREYWLDVGRLDDLDQARRDFDRVFGWSAT